MDFARKVAAAYQFALNGLAKNNKDMIRALTMLALEDIEYCDAIALVIQQQVYKVILIFIHSTFFQKKNIFFIHLFKFD